MSVLPLIPGQIEPKMSSNPDPHATASSAPETTTDEMDRFARRFLNFALKGSEQEDSPAVIERRAAIRQQAAQDMETLQQELRDHTIDGYDDMDADAIAADLNRVFGKVVTITKVSDTCSNISINGVVEMDPISLRLLAPHKRAEIFKAANMTNGSAEQAEALKKLGGPLRLRTDMHVSAGKTHLGSLVKPPHDETLNGLYAKDGENNAGAHRAFDIGNKLACYKEGTDAYKLARDSQGAMLNMAMTMDPQSLGEMVVNFEFAEMTFDAEADTRALTEATTRVAAEKASEVAKMRADLETKDQMLAEVEKTRQSLAAEAARIEAIEPPKARKKPQKLLSKKQRKLEKQEAYLRDLTPENIASLETTPRPVAISKPDKEAAKRALIDEISKNPEARDAMVAAMEATLKDYTDAVPLTGNEAGSTDVAQNMTDITLNARVASGAASKLRFGSNKTAGYHTLKHHDEMADTSEADRLDFPTDVQKKVAHYHQCARAAVADGTVIQSAVSQNGGESHLYKHRGVTAIVWMRKGKAGLATFFKKG